MNQQNAFDRIAELEAKLAIATQNCEQAVKERDELREAILMLGVLTGAEGYFGDEVVLTVRLNIREADTWNALVAKLCAKGEEGKP